MMGKTFFRGILSIYLLTSAASMYADLRPEFPGGGAELKRYVEAAKQYPDSLPKSGVDSVVASFMVEKTGHITNISVSGTKIPSVAREVKRLAENMPTWKPADVGGVVKRSRASFTVVYNYKLNEKQRQSARPQDYIFRDSLVDDYQRVLNRNGMWNFLYKNGNDILPYNYEHLYHYPDGTVRASHNNKYGLLNCNNEEILPYEFDELYYYEDGYCRVKKDGKWGLYSSTGKTIVPCRYDTIGLFGLDNSFGDVFDEDFLPGKIVMRDIAYVKLGSKSGFISRNGREEIPVSYDEMYPFSTGYSVFKLNGKMGLYNDLGKIVVSARYDDMKYFHSNLALVRNGNFYGIADELGQAVFPCLFDTIMPFSTSLDVVMAKKKGKYGLYDLSSLPLFECEYDTICPSRDVRNSIVLTKGSIKEVQPFIFETVLKSRNVVVDDIVRVERKGKWGFALKSDNSMCIPAIFDYADEFYNGYAVVNIDDKWGIINPYGREVVPVKYDYINPFSYGLARFSKDGKMGFVDENGKEVIPAVYVHVYPFVNGLSVVNKKDYIDVEGKFVPTQIEGLVRSEGSPCSFIPDQVRKAFPNYQPPFLFPGDVCEYDK